MGRLSGALKIAIRSDTVTAASTAILTRAVFHSGQRSIPGPLTVDAPSTAELFHVARAYCRPCSSNVNHRAVLPGSPRSPAMCVPFGSFAIWFIGFARALSASRIDIPHSSRNGASRAQRAGSITLQPSSMKSISGRANRNPNAGPCTMLE